VTSVVVCESCSILWRSFVSISSCAFSVLPPDLRFWFGFFSCYAHEQEPVRFSQFAASGFRFAYENSCSCLSFLWQEPVRSHFSPHVFSYTADLRPSLSFAAGLGPSFP
jgi:hypothetical protein